MSGVGGFILSLVGGGIVEKFTGPIERAWQAKLAADNSDKRLDAERAIASLENQRDIAVAEARDRFSATRVGRWLIVVPFGLWWAAIWLIQIINPWFGLNLVVIAVPPDIMEMAKVLVPAIVIGDAATFVGRMFKR